MDEQTYGHRDLVDQKYKINATHINHSKKDKKLGVQNSFLWFELLSI